MVKDGLRLLFSCVRVFHFKWQYQDPHGKQNFYFFLIFTQALSHNGMRKTVCDVWIHTFRISPSEINSKLALKITYKYRFFSSLFCSIGYEICFPRRRNGKWIPQFELNAPQPIYVMCKIEWKMEIESFKIKKKRRKKNAKYPCSTLNRINITQCFSWCSSDLVNALCMEFVLRTKQNEKIFFFFSELWCVSEPCSTCM